MTETKSLREARNTLSRKLFDALLEAEVILRPGFVFQGQSDAERDAARDTYAYMRLAFSKVEVSAPLMFTQSLACRLIGYGLASMNN